MKKIFFLIVATTLVVDTGVAGSMSTSAVLWKNDVSPRIAIMSIQISSDGGSYASYTDLSGQTQPLHPPAADGSFSFHAHLIPGSYSWQFGATAIANDLSLWSAPYDQPKSDNAYTHYTFSFAANPADGVTILSGLDSTMGGGEANNTFGGVYSWATIFDSTTSSASPDGNVRFGSHSISANAYYDPPVPYLYFESVSASYSAILSPSNSPPTCLIDLVCLAHSSTISPEPDGFRVGFAYATTAASFDMQIASTNTSPADCTLTFAKKFTANLGPISNGQSLGILPAARSLATSPYFPSYIFTNVPTGSLIGIPANDGVDYEFSFTAVNPTLFQSLTLPNCTNSLTVTVSNVNLGSFSGGQTVYFTNYPSGGVGQFDVSANGQPFPPISGLELPLVLTFNSPTGAFTLTPQAIRIVAPVTDQTLKPGQDLTIQPILHSEQSIQYQWQLEGADLPNQTNALLIIPNFTAANTGHYRLKMQSEVGGQPQTFYSPESLFIAVSAPTLSNISIANGTNGSLQFIANGTPGQPFVVESSSDLLNWQIVATNSIPQNGDVVLQVNNDPATPIRFMRTSTLLTWRLEL